MQKIVQKQAKMPKVSQNNAKTIFVNVCKKQKKSQLWKISTDGIRGIKTFFNLCVLFITVWAVNSEVMFGVSVRYFIKIQMFI